MSWIMLQLFLCYAKPKATFLFPALSRYFRTIFTDLWSLIRERCSRTCADIGLGHIDHMKGAVVISTVGFLRRVATRFIHQESVWGHHMHPCSRGRTLHCASSKQPETHAHPIKDRQCFCLERPIERHQARARLLDCVEVAFAVEVLDPK